MARIFLATKKGMTCGIKFEEVKGKKSARKFTITNDVDTEIVGIPGTVKSALRAVVKILEEADVKKMKNTNQIFVITYLHDMISNETYKYWILTGKNSKGEDIDKDYLDLWKKFYSLMQEKGLYFTFKDLFKARIPDKVIQNKTVYGKFSLESRENNSYARQCQEAVAEMYSDDLDDQIVEAK